MQKYTSAIVMTIWSLACITLGALMGYCAEKYDDHLLSPRSSAPVPPSDHTLRPGRIMTITAYCPCKKCCGKWADGYTSSGVRAVGKIVAAPPGMPFGTVLEIPGYGRCRVQDRGGAIVGDKLDVLFATHEAAKQWGVQELLVWEVE